VTFTIVPSKRLQKTIQKYRKGGKKRILELLTEVIDLLALHDARSLLLLGTRWQDHPLKGTKSDVRELHLSQDDLLLYALDEELSITKLIDIVSHEELRKMCYRIAEK